MRGRRDSRTAAAESPLRAIALLPPLDEGGFVFCVDLTTSENHATIIVQMFDNEVRMSIHINIDNVVRSTKKWTILQNGVSPAQKIIQTVIDGPQDGCWYVKI